MSSWYGSYAIALGVRPGCASFAESLDISAAVAQFWVFTEAVSFSRRLEELLSEGAPVR